MDYHVFILTRIREAFDHGRSTEEAVTHGIKTTAGVVTSAAAVMISVFAIFATLSLLIFKQLGIGLAVAVFIDATVIRGVLLPASMKLLGDWNWYLPRWLEWLPRVSHEPEMAAVDAAAEAPAVRDPAPAADGAAAPAPAGGTSRLTAEVLTENGRVRVRLEGELDVVTAPRLAKALHEAEATAPEVLMVDLRGLTFMDSTGIRELF